MLTAPELCQLLCRLLSSQYPIFKKMYEVDNALREYSVLHLRGQGRLRKLSQVISHVNETPKQRQFPVITFSLENDR